LLLPASYAQLVKTCPEVEEYKLFYAQSLFKSCQYSEALKAATAVEGTDLGQKVRALRCQSTSKTPSSNKHRFTQRPRMLKRWMESSRFAPPPLISSPVVWPW
jgi:hypothetical protein